VLILGPGAYGSARRSSSTGAASTPPAPCAPRLRTLMVNHKPRDVSTDYDECDRLYFDELSEAVSEIYRKEAPLASSCRWAARFRNNLALRWLRGRMRVLGTSPRSIDTRPENRDSFSACSRELGCPSRRWQELSSSRRRQRFASEHGFPVIVRAVVRAVRRRRWRWPGSDEELNIFLDKAVEISPGPSRGDEQVHRERQGDRRRRRWPATASWCCGGVRSTSRMPASNVRRCHRVVLPPSALYWRAASNMPDPVITPQVARSMNITDRSHPVPRQGQPGDGDRVQSARLRSFPFVSKVLKRNFIDGRRPRS